MHKVYLKKNIESKIKEIYSKYKNVKKLDIERDIFSIPQNKNLHFKRQSDGGYTFFHNSIYSNKELDLIELIGNISCHSNGIKVNQQMISSNYYENLYFSTLLIDEYSYNDEKLDSLYIRISQIPNDEISFNIRFVGKDYLNICNNIKRGQQVFDEFERKKVEHCGINLHPFYLGYYSAKGFNVNKSDIIYKSECKKDSIEIVINFRSLEVFFSNFERIFCLNYLKKHIRNRFIAISSSWNKPASYVIESVGLGKNTGYLTLEENYYGQHYEVVADGRLELIDNKIKLNSFSKIYEIYSYNI